MKSNISTIMIACLICLSSCRSEKGDIPDIVQIIPEPSHIERLEGHFAIQRNTTIYIENDDKAWIKTASMFNEILSTTAGFSLAFADELPQRDAICFMEVPSIAPEGYHLRVGSRRIIIESSDAAGAFYALQTLTQMMPDRIYSGSRQRGPWDVPCADIEDAPRFKYRGMHIDCCLHFFNIPFLKRYIDLMAMHKINRFHWHLTDDQGWRIEIDKYPLLTEKGQWRKETVVGSLKSGVYDGRPHGGFYSKDEIRELVSYAADRHVTVIPEIEMPGHALAALSCYPELGCGLEENYETATKWGVFKQVFCPKETTFRFLEDILDEVMELFPSELIHIGGDECPKDSWKQCSHCQKLIRDLNLKDEEELQSWFVSRIADYVESKGRKVIGWDEILQGGLARNASVMSWRGEDGGIEAARARHDVVMSPHFRYYLDYWQADPESEPLAMGGPVTLRDVYDYNPIPDVLEPSEARHIIGIQGCMWTEYTPTPERVEYMSWPRMCAIAETGWSTGKKNWDNFSRRVERNFKRLDLMGVNACRAFFSPVITLHKDTDYSAVVTMAVDLPDAEIRYTLDGSTPDTTSSTYTQPFVINRQQCVAAVAFRGGEPAGEIKYKKMYY